MTVFRDLLGKASTRPWKADGTLYGRGTVFTCPTPQNGGVVECVANRALIVAAVNCLEAHEAVAEAMREFLDSMWAAWIDWKDMPERDRDDLNSLVEDMDAALARLDAARRGQA